MRFIDVILFHLQYNARPLDWVLIGILLFNTFKIRFLTKVILSSHFCSKKYREKDKNKKSFTKGLSAFGRLKNGKTKKEKMG